MKRSAFILGICLLAATSVMAQQTKEPAGSAMQAAVDEKGQLRQPTAEEIRALAAATQPRTMLRVEPRVHADGMVSIELDESFDHAFVVRMDETGELSYVCTDDHTEAAAFQASAASIDTILRIKPIAPRDIRNAEKE